jgi:hypothetical protein
MLSLKTRIVALAATGALAALLALPAFAQALWWVDDVVDRRGDTKVIGVAAERRSSAQTVNIAYDSTGPSVSGPSSISIPAGETSGSFTVTTGEGFEGDEIWVGMSGPTTQGACYLYLVEY